MPLQTRGGLRKLTSTYLAVLSGRRGVFSIGTRRGSAGRGLGRHLLAIVRRTGFRRRLGRRGRLLRSSAGLLFWHVRVRGSRVRRRGPCLLLPEFILVLRAPLQNNRRGGPGDKGSRAKQ